MAVNDLSNIIATQLNPAYNKSSALEAAHQSGDMPDGFIDKPG
jgi:hypothetical protein